MRISDWSSYVCSSDLAIDAAYGNVDLATGSGSLTVGVPDGVSVRLDVMTGSGVLQSDLLVEQEPRPGARTITLRAQTRSEERVEGKSVSGRVDPGGRRTL